MLTIPNFISLLRAPLALLFLTDQLLYRTLAILLAMLTDYLDGKIARRYHLSSNFGTMIDPIMDKFFVLFVLAILIQEDRVTLLEATILMCRDYSVFIFGIYLTLTGTLTKYPVRAIWCGKITTTLQFLVLLGLIYQAVIPPFLLVAFVVLGILAFAELYFVEAEGTHRKTQSS